MAELTLGMFLMTLLTVISYHQVWLHPVEDHSIAPSKLSPKGRLEEALSSQVDLLLFERLKRSPGFDMMKKAGEDMKEKGAEKMEEGKGKMEEGKGKMEEGKEKMKDPKGSASEGAESAKGAGEAMKDKGEEKFKPGGRRHFHPADEMEEDQTRDKRSPTFKKKKKKGGCYCGKKK